ncbi:hypothetical protein CDD81_5630 [Ophiocordyceps australis]|uniref:L-tryptophan decarboxylase PsiD-like domain-containing protein n=1 Tax=Ophiocordyceps australis TaxID=1399860 RepID=A0A2C5X9Y0_9HYPO|nr:hypothetical protein CDD81_5630 [Ophiocordyceps australis]
MSKVVPIMPVRPHHRFHRVGGWLPENPNVVIRWLKDLVKDVDRRKRTPNLVGPVQELKALIESTAELRMLASAMFDEVPDKDPYREDPVGNKQVRSYKHMLILFQVIMSEVAPKWSMTEYGVGLIGFPFNALLDWPMATASGYAFFLKTEVNAKLKDILDTWRSTVLTTDKSLYVLVEGEDGWLGPEPRAKIESDTNVTDHPELKFHELFECNPDEPHWGFKHWDDFFIRKFRNFDKIRPTAFKDRPEWIVNSCESKPFALQLNVQANDTFWLKGQPYSVREMLNGHEWADKFVGGTVYQAFLSATSYHRWNSPVTGKVVHSQIIDGTYFSEPTITGFTSPEGPDPAAPDQAQGYITHIATRALVFIEAAAPVGLVAIVYVGMSDVSSCEILQKFESSKLPVNVTKGEELGMFHHGGSTHAMLFGKDVKLAWVTGAMPGALSHNLAVRSELAMVYKK